MKIRNGFVSNSSSSSFICEVCGTIESGWDACIEDMDMIRCIGGHELCKSCVSIPEDKDSLEDITVIDGDWEEQAVDEKHCPACNLTVIDDALALRYLLSKVKYTKDSIRQEIRNVFENIDQLIEALRTIEN